MPQEVIVIGAGACGLTIARILSNAGKQVCVLEARDRPGGRILTIPSGDFSMRIEAGAEFVHGKLPFTLRLLKEAGISFHETSGSIWNASSDHPHKQSDFIEDQRLFNRKLKELKNDMSVGDFMETNFKGEKYDELRASIRGYVEGYDLAEVDKASTFSLREEWINDDEDEQYRIDNGYAAMISFLKNECDRNRTEFDFDCIIKKVEWRKNEVKLTAANEKTWTGKKLIVTVPLGVLQAEPSSKAFIDFNPSISDKIVSARAMGYGEIIKFILEFNESFWENKKLVDKHRMQNPGFIFSRARVPTWWTQSPVTSPILTGWLGGPRVRECKKMNEEGLLQMAIDSLSSIFDIDHAVLIEKLVAWRIFNWSEDSFALGGYAYNSLDRDKHLSTLAAPIEGTLFFSGEAIEKGPTLGTVEAALAAAEHTAHEVLKSY